MNKDHVTHFDDCGCLTARYEARIATLEAELAAPCGTCTECREALDAARNLLAEQIAHANALRDASVSLLHEFEENELLWPARDRLREVVAQTPAASLAALKAEVLERARDAAHNAIHDAVYEMGECARVKSAVDDAIRARAAQDATHSVPDGTSEVKP